MATATAQQPLMDAIYTTLNNASNVTALVASRIYDTDPPQNPTQPYIQFSVVTDPPKNYFESDDILTIFQVDSFGKLEAGAKATRQIADAVYFALNRDGAMTASGYTGLSILCVDRGTAVPESILGPRTQQDPIRQTQIYKLFGSGS